ncbi:hypothetical protein EVAR_53850_1 [Eumeta japonica]|uniref:Uncharacterized protein n=1 Tax=Eumeta variegata TaxID=151549 RepID=A0A4C1XGE7_EUMVA|nr:hypothetical protein EVAR_53850_1 [Eumeta japonica]
MTRQACKPQRRKRKFQTGLQPTALRRRHENAAAVRLPDRMTRVHHVTYKHGIVISNRRTRVTQKVDLCSIYDPRTDVPEGPPIKRAAHYDRGSNIIRGIQMYTPPAGIISRRKTFNRSRFTRVALPRTGPRSCRERPNSHMTVALALAGRGRPSSSPADRTRDRQLNMLSELRREWFKAKYALITESDSVPPRSKVTHFTTDPPPHGGDGRISHNWHEAFSQTKGPRRARAHGVIVILKFQPGRGREIYDRPQPPGPCIIPRVHHVRRGRRAGGALGGANTDTLVSSSLRAKWCGLGLLRAWSSSPREVRDRQFKLLPRASFQFALRSEFIDRFPRDRGGNEHLLVEDN